MSHVSLPVESMPCLAEGIFGGIGGLKKSDQEWIEYCNQEWIKNVMQWFVKSHDKPIGDPMALISSEGSNKRLVGVCSGAFHSQTHF